jgi:DNA-binding CsgD family transcriptional regulator
MSRPWTKPPQTVSSHRLPVFTARERQVAQELLRGASRRQLASRLGVSEHTVGDHLRHLYRKAAVSGRAELAATLFGRHYLPPRSAGVPPSPYGYFVGLDREGSARLSH